MEDLCAQLLRLIPNKYEVNGRQHKFTNFILSSSFKMSLILHIKWPAIKTRHKIDLEYLVGVIDWSLRDKRKNDGIFIKYI